MTEVFLQGKKAFCPEMPVQFAYQKSSITYTRRAAGPHIIFLIIGGDHAG